MVTDFALILSMALVTYATRAIGFVVMRESGATDSLASHLDLVASLILAAILAWSLVNSTWQVLAGVSLGAVAMVLTGRFFLSMWLGVGATAIVRFLF